MGDGRLTVNSMDGGRMIGVDIGGTKIAVGVVDGSGAVLANKTFPNQLDLGPEATLEQTVLALREVMLASDTALDGGNSKGLGIGCASPLDSEQGVILSPPNLPGWDHFPIRKILEDALGLRTVLDNDANAAALGESRFGAGRGARNMIYLTVSTGIGGGVIIDGKLFRGSRMNAGEAGHQTLNPDGPLCGCGQKGCLEAYASGTGIGKLARRRAKENPGTLMIELAGGAENINARIAAEAARKGDPLAIDVMREAGYWLGIGIANLANVLDPDCVVLGGGVSKSLELMIDAVREQVEKRVLAPPTRELKILRAELGDMVGVVGAAALVDQNGLGA